MQMKQEIVVIIGLSKNYNFPSQLISRNTPPVHTEGNKFSNKFHFKHPQLHLMKSQKIKEFLIENEIQRVMVFTDGWTDTKYNDEYGKMYINPRGKIISDSPDNKSRREIPPGFQQIKLPIAYFLRDIIVECAELENIKVFVFQSLKHYSQILKHNGKNVAIDKQLMANKLLALSLRKETEQEFYNKLIVSSLMNSLIGVKGVHSLYLPLILAYSNPGMNSSAYTLYKTLTQSFRLRLGDTSDCKVPNLPHEFSFLTSERV